ncbi:hypothetical protein HY251_03135 [bacterium]|nr:hypothetical protein [bacterium]
MSSEKRERLPAETPSETLAEATKGQTVPTAFATPAPGSAPPAKPEEKREERSSARVKLACVDPGKERGLPPPVQHHFQGGEKVRLTKTQVYGQDGVTIKEGEIGFLVNPSSQAACWAVRFPKAGCGKLRIVPEWELEPQEPSRATH